MIYYGKQAIAAAEAHLGFALKPEWRRACYLEGFSDMPYFDIKGIETTLMGLTGEWIHKGLEAALNHHDTRVMNRFPEYPTYNIELRKELFQAEWRGDLGHSPKACKLINARQFAEAAEEFLNNDEYRNSGDGIRHRMEAVYYALRLYALVREI